MAAQLSNIAQFCDDLSFVIAGRGSAQNADRLRRSLLSTADEVIE
jgi:hypothetical protein